ncbi:hypothetical protein EJ07DRAFT_76447, partial [Lizonia empirigonia]
GYGSGYGETPESTPGVYPSSSIYAPTGAVGTSSSIAYGNGYPVPSAPAGGVSSVSTPAGAESTPGVYPSSSIYAPTGAVGTSSSPVGTGASSSTLASASKPVYPNGYPSGSGPRPTGVTAFPSGTGSGSYPETTPMSDYVTSIIYSTQIFTVTACPSTVSDCPARSTSLVTSVIVVGTTVCPESDLTTATSAPSAPAVVTSAYPVSEVPHEVTETLTYTVGVGSSAHPVTTEVTSTSIQTIYSTVVVTKDTPTETKPAGSYPTGPAG